MKIMFVTEFFPTGKDLRFSGGVEARTYYVGKYLAKKHKVYVICSHQPGSKRREIIDGMYILRVGASLKYNAGSGKINLIKLLSFILKAVKVGEKIKPDVVDGGNFIAHTIAKQISVNINIPVVFWYPDVFIGKWIKTSGIISGVGGWFNERLNLLRSSDQFIAISKTTKDKLLDNGVANSLITVIPCGVEHKEFRKKIKKQQVAQIICISRLVRYKRVVNLIWAFAALMKKGVDVGLLIIGEGPEQKKLNNLTKMLKIDRSVTFRKNLPRKQLINCLKSSHLFCLPSQIEGFGISVIEACAAGIPYVISSIPVFKEITKGGKGGLMFETGNINDLSKKLEKLLVDKKLYLAKSKEAELLAENYDWQIIAKQTENAYKQLI